MKCQQDGIKLGEDTNLLNFVIKTDFDLKLTGNEALWQSEGLSSFKMKNKRAEH